MPKCTRCGLKSVKSEGDTCSDCSLQEDLNPDFSKRFNNDILSTIHSVKESDKGKEDAEFEL